MTSLQHATQGTTREQFTGEIVFILLAKYFYYTLKSEIRIVKSEVRNLEIRRPKTKVRGQKSKVRSQRSDIICQM